MSSGRKGAIPSARFLFCLNLIHDVIPFHQLDALLGQLDGAGGAVACAGLLFTGIVREALRPCHRQQVRALFKIGIAPLQILAFGEHCPQDAALLPRPNGLHGVQRDGGGMEAR